MMNKTVYTLKWFDAEWHTLTYTNWAQCAKVLNRLVMGGMKVEVTK